jgi:hypothetical protein
MHNQHSGLSQTLAEQHRNELQRTNCPPGSMGLPRLPGSPIGLGQAVNVLGSLALC